ncbi:centrosomal protein of 164 kDa isoform X2 [Leptopilina heterotoma]|uniref:centrosomal protein of 164 kDa isoform X2 n=1 Tax=Leptopilina heterotoma TaxID=63436 RepID=UPI001CA94BF4|nr:centrosomal protein of 164 kDa isoform X2 [Leptopilina heterotoma]
MSISQDSAATIVCREVFDETSHPSNEEVIEYAKRLGIDPDAEPHLLDLAREGLMAALPKGWSPCFHEASGAWYYYQASTGNTTWEHPLDAVYKELVAQARAGNRQMSVDEDSKTTAKDLESQEDATLPKDSTTSKTVIMSQTKIPMKLAPLKRIKSSDKLTSRRRESSLEKITTKNYEKDIHSESSIIVSDRASRDYRNLKFQDPMFYETPKLLDAGATTTTTMNSSSSNNNNNKSNLDLKEVLKRSESLSPRYEKEWEHLNSKFNSDENIIDIDRLSASSLAKVEKSSESCDKEKHPRQKELTLTGGGSIFLKSNRSRDTTPSQDGGKFEDFQLSADLGMSSSSGDRLKSILREKAYEDDDRPMEEERKSVRFDLEKEPDIKFTYSDSDEDWESESDEQNVKISSAIANIKKGASIFSLQSQNLEPLDESSTTTTNQNSRDLFFNPTPAKLNPLDKFLKKSTIVGKRFVVENVSENEHLNQISRERLNTEIDDDYSPRRFSNVRNIDLISKSETDSSAASKSSLLDEIRKSKELMLESMRLSDQTLKNEREKNEDYFLKQKQEAPTTSHHHNDETRTKILSQEHEETIHQLKIEYQEKLEIFKKDLEVNFHREKFLLEKNQEEKLSKLRSELEMKEEQEIEKLVSKMDEARNENLKKVKNELEVCYEKERQEILTNLKIELDQRKHELLELRNKEMEKLENDHEKYLDDEKNAKIKEQKITKQHTEKLDNLRKDFDKEFDDRKTELRLQQREKVTKINEEHEKCLAEMLRDFRTDEELARKLYKQRLEEIRADFSRDIENEVKRQSDRKSSPQEIVDYEKLRCEKRLIEDKYNTLKEKYLKLKKEVRLAVERRTKRKEGNATASETDKSTSARARTDKPESSDQKSPLKKTRSNSLTLTKSQENQSQGHSATEDSDDQKLMTGFPGSIGTTLGGKQLLKFESDDTTTASETNSNFLSKKKKNFTKRTTSTSRLNNNVNSENPVENIRKQLEKLEDLGDQLPSNETAYTLRYPFQDKCESSRGDTAKLTPVSASSELEFFRHRIHVERDSVRRAREALRQQRSAFQGRQKAWKQRSARATLEQLVKEERELSDMEVSLHRTRSLLGEKVIHLRHLEQSLDRVANAKKNENDATVVKSDEQTLSDMSSASSGFSSTDLGTDTFMDKQDHYQESTEIIASLENLNSEIREIWGVLNKRQDNNVPPPPTLMYSDLGWLPYQHLTSQPSNVQAFGTPNIQSNILSQLSSGHPPTANTQNIIAQYGPNSGFTTSVGTVERATSNLMERTRNLRDWLRQARVETSDLVSPGQATL